MALLSAATAVNGVVHVISAATVTVNLRTSRSEENLNGFRTMA